MNNAWKLTEAPAYTKKPAWRGEDSPDAKSLASLSVDEQYKPGRR